ncbi:uncharacterized protein LOC128265795 isoform X1 [Drosophila gunungcola]|uniref:uncharacterized protein LOC128265795 isoform X1 n=1 Tax=Drosophila gunungcola TaxID=103775 RepID=UPI0022E3D563|nr:uncharacterized protein LOC128265795 isoform X1 [Drosophila gunungcola]
MAPARPLLLLLLAHLLLLLPHLAHGRSTTSSGGLTVITTASTAITASIATTSSHSTQPQAIAAISSPRKRHRKRNSNWIDYRNFDENTTALEWANPCGGNYHPSAGDRFNRQRPRQLQSAEATRLPGVPQLKQQPGFGHRHPQHDHVVATHAQLQVPAQAQAQFHDCPEALVPQHANVRGQLRVSAAAADPLGPAVYHPRVEYRPRAARAAFELAAHSLRTGDGRQPDAESAPEAAAQWWSGGYGGGSGGGGDLNSAGGGSSAADLAPRDEQAFEAALQGGWWLRLGGSSSFPKHPLWLLPWARRTPLTCGS